MTAQISPASQFAAKGITLMDRVQGNGGTNITQSAISSIAYSVIRFASQKEAEDCRNGGTPITGTLDKTSVVFNTLQTAAPWDSGADAAGYNVRYDSPATDRPVDSKPGTFYDRYDIVFTPTSGAKFSVVWIVETLACPI